jgi:hypothetical protein
MRKIEIFYRIQSYLLREVKQTKNLLLFLIYFFHLASNNLIIQELFRLNLNDKGVLPASPSLRHHPNTFHGSRDFKRNESFGGKQLSNMPQHLRTLPEKTNGNTFERTGGTAMRTVAFHFKVNIDSFKYLQTRIISLSNKCIQFKVMLSLHRSVNDK